MLKICFILFWVITQTEHVSFMGVECFPEKGVIKLFLKMNYDDFVYDYRFIVNDDENFNPTGKIDTTIIFVDRYLTERIQIFADENNLKGHLTKIESANGELNMELLYYYNKRSKRFKVKNTILSGLGKNHSALVIFRYNDFEDEVKLTQEKTEQTFLTK